MFIKRKMLAWIKSLIYEQSKELTEFYIAYNMWLETGAPDRKPFSRSGGLCTNLMVYSHSIRINCYYDILEEMYQQFKDAGFVDPLYPFGGRPVFDNERYSKSMHLNPDRIKWVKNHLA